MFILLFARWRPSRHSIALAIALLQIKVKPCSKHRVFNKLFNFFITSFTSWFFLTKIDDIAILLTPYDLDFFPTSIILYVRSSASTLLKLNLVISFEPMGKITVLGCSSTNVEFAWKFSCFVFEPLKHLTYTLHYHS